jgi:(1->4)-alpha-D-glucan 1-alpha-D-glucosylmutase
VTSDPIRPRIPDATYRLQFNGGFTFRNATAVLAYLQDLGVSDIYASPYFRAKTGSIHGYDIIDHGALNPEIGTAEDYAGMVAELRRRGMGQVLDIVPNHMCVDSSGNAWWMDVLENGPSSPYAAFFDIDWTPVKKELTDKVLIPVLGDQYGNVLENRELSLTFEHGAFFISYFDHRLPVRPQTYALILEHRLDDLRAALGEDAPDLAEHLSIITAIRHLPSYTGTDAAGIAERNREKEVIKRRLAALTERSDTIRAHLDANVELYNGTKGDPRSFDLLDALLSQQVYRLSYWRVATEEINYRRFFDVNSLGAIRVEHPEVFDAAHALVLELVRNGSVTGLRVDHPDGLYDPVEYFRRLQRACFVHAMLPEPGDAASGPDAAAVLAQRYDEEVAADPQYKPFYIVGEKILMRSERMPEDWPIFSTTGYVFMNSVNGLFVNGEASKEMDGVYEKFTRTRRHFADCTYETRKLVMQVAMSSEINTLGHYLNDISEENRHTRDFTLNSLTGAIIEVIACFPVYRTYTSSWTVSDKDRQYIEQAVSRAERKNPAISGSIFEFLKDVLLLRFPKELSERERTAWLDFVMRFQQITGPVMAKGVEDTAFYVYNRLLSLNEVGGSPDRFGTLPETFHGQNIERAKNWPYAMISTATHDAKRGEDVRARINVLSEVPAEWGEHVRRWARLNRKRKTLIDGLEAPDRNDEYLLYQTLVGAWPMEGNGGRNLDGFVARIKEYMIKACREAKVNTSWISPNAPYEAAVLKFVDGLLTGPKAKPFLDDLLPFQRMIAHYGMYNSLSQTLLKVCAPGVPDIYQGTELWDLSLVDPDNRRPVDFDLRSRMLQELDDAVRVRNSRDIAWELSLSREDGKIKLYTLSRALRFRQERGALFRDGAYLPLEASGGRAQHLCAFQRSLGGAEAVVVVPRLLAGLISGTGSVPFSKAVWEDTAVLLPGAAPGELFRNVFTGEVVEAAAGEGGAMLSAADVLASFPVALLERTRQA